MREKTDISSLRQAVENRSIEDIRILLNNNQEALNLDEQYCYGVTALMKAFASNSRDIVEALLKAEANPNIKNRHGWTALMYAAIYGNYKENLNMVRLLLKYKANSSVIDKNEKTIIDIAKSSYAPKGKAEKEKFVSALEILLEEDS